MWYYILLLFIKSQSKNRTRTERILCVRRRRRWAKQSKRVWIARPTDFLDEIKRNKKHQRNEMKRDDGKTAWAAEAAIPYNKNLNWAHGWNIAKCFFCYMCVCVSGKGENWRKKEANNNNKKQQKLPNEPSKRNNTYHRVDANEPKILCSIVFNTFNSVYMLIYIYIFHFFSARVLPKNHSHISASVRTHVHINIIPSIQGSRILKAKPNSVCIHTHTRTYGVYIHICNERTHSLTHSFVLSFGSFHSFVIFFFFSSLLWT